MTVRAKQMLTLAGLLLIGLATIPMFFDTYRMAAFNTVPHDDYASYLLALVGQGGEIAGSPRGYRIVSTAISIPFYHLLPLIKFSQLQDVDIAYLKATQAIAFSSYIWVVLTPVAIFAIARKQFNASKASALIVSLLTFLLSGYIAEIGVDPLAIFVICMLILWMDKPLRFSLLLFACIVINEKILILFVAVLTCRWLASMIMRKHFNQYIQLLASYAAIAGYFLMISVVKLPGNENQTDLASFTSQVKSVLLYSLTPTGIVLNVLPVTILILIIMGAILFRRQNGFLISDISGLLILLSVVALTGVLTAGRVAMYSYPFYLPAMCVFIDYLVGQEQSL
ncbi:MAG: hypothetical protein M9941_13040 [Anaerolineae bacterium]|nr:hypothetical protein [Anaerolineae bacterium]MCO5198662.1 hypothetical protein [Anaerolineae bacterium]